MSESGHRHRGVGLTTGRYTAGHLEELDRLSRIPFLADLADEDRRQLTASLRRRRYPRNEVIFHQDDPGNCLFILVSGAVKIIRRSLDGRELILSLIAPGEYFGELSLLDGEPRSADAVALEASELLVLPRDTFLRTLETTPSAAIRLLASLSRLYARRLTDVVEDATFLDVSARLARVLVHLGRNDQRTPPRTELTQTALSAMVGATRESVNKWLGFFERRGWVRRERGELLLLDMESLTGYAARE